MRHFTKAEAAAARNADLYSFLTTEYGGEIVNEGGTISLKANRSVHVSPGQSLFYDFGSKDDRAGGRFTGRPEGNAIDLLISYLGYSIGDAVAALLPYSSLSARATTPVKRAKRIKPAAAPVKKCIIWPPEAADAVRVINYLTGRGISRKTLDIAISRKILYESAAGACIFRGLSWGEMRQTAPAATPQHAMVSGSAPDGFWFFQPVPGKSQKCYICEGAIDALSLWELTGETAVYISIGGAGKQKAIDRLKPGHRLIIATDADKAGDACRTKNPELESLRPSGGKDWNDILCPHP